MLHKLSENIADYFFDEKDQYPKEVYIYGIELTISSALGSLTILLIGVISGYIIESFIFMTGLTSVRIFTGGYHADTYLKCNIVTLIAAVFSVISYWLIREFVMYSVTEVILSAAGSALLITIYLFCPVANKNKPVPEEDKKKLKVISLAIVLIGMVVCYVLYHKFDFEQVLIFIPTMIVVNISILAEIILNKRRLDSYESEKRR